MRGVLIAWRRRILGPLALVIAASASLAPCAWAQDAATGQERSIDLSFYARQGVSRLFPSATSLFGSIDPNSSWGHETELRLMADVRWRSWLQLEVHNETFYQGGRARRPAFAIANDADVPLLDTDGLMNDSRRLLDLSWTMASDADRLLVNRFDRLSATAILGRSRLRVGRQVVTWGNGLLFNPFDLFSPYAPTDIDRDYKRGEDGASWSVDAGDRLGHFEAVSLLKRDGETGATGLRQGSFGVKHHRMFDAGRWEITSMAGRHFGDTVLGGGIMGRVGDFVGRSEWVHTTLPDGAGSALTGVVNLDVAWVWKDMNSHAGVEYYFSGVGIADEADQKSRRARALHARLARGELFVRGRHYLDSVFHIEPHPLVRVALNTIVNLSDESGVLQPSLIWDVSSRMQARITATCMWGTRGTEFGGVATHATGLSDRMPNRIDMRITTTF
jgi:hypothetical protein